VGPLIEASEYGLGRTGSGVCMAGDPGCLLVTFDIAAFNTWVKLGFMPQARQGGRGVCAVAVAGSKLEGKGFEKVHIVQTQVAGVAGTCSTGGARKGLSVRCAGDEVPAREEKAGGRGWSDERLVALGVKVILGDEFQKPACGDGFQQTCAKW